MTAKCTKCNLHWNISIKKEVHLKGYICPRCIAKMKEGGSSGKTIKGQAKVVKW